jgi:glucosylceramidase
MIRRSTRLSCAFLIVYLISSACTNTERFCWIETSEKSVWTQKYGLGIEQAIDSSFDAEVFPLEQQQQIDGFGACFNELGWDALMRLDQEKREEIMKNLFDTVLGLKLNICRMPIGANDYSRSYYSLDDSVDDFEMRYFNIERDKQTLIPFIKLALKYNPLLRIWGSPWCPPSWMKTNMNYACLPGRVNNLKSDGAGKEGCTEFRMQEKYLKAYAVYFSKYIASYRSQGIPVFSIQVQNEPNSCQNFPSCIWTAKDMNTFIGKYLGPAITKEFRDIQIWYGTIERPWVEKIDTIMIDPESARFITGVGFQWAGKLAIPGVYKKYPKLKLMQTETECGDGSNDWKAAEYTFSLMKHYFSNGAGVYTFWNPVLDESGKSQWGWKQNSMISINSKTLKVKYNPEYYLLKHFSSFIKAGARKLETKGKYSNILAFRNPDGKIILITQNSETIPLKLKIREGDKIIIALLSPKSFNTIVLDLI